MLFLKILLGIVCLYVAVWVFLYFFQTSMLFIPQKENPEKVAILTQSEQFRHLSYTNSDGFVLDWWQQIDPEKTKTVLFFDGNAGNIVDFIAQFSLPDANFIAFNYRGYGKSTGKPSEAVVFADALFLYDTLTQEGIISPENTYIMGRSIGSGVATYLASKRPSQGVILITPFDSIEQIAKERFPMYPISWILQNKFLSIQYAQEKPNRVLIIYGAKDTLVKNANTERLFEAWNGEKEKFLLPDFDHDNIIFSEEMWKKIENFL